MSLNKALQDLKFDKRLFEINMRLGRLSPEEIEKYNKSLTDLEAQSEKLDIENSNGEAEPVND